MPGVMKKLYSPAVFDAMFAAAAITSLTGIVVDTGRYYKAIEAADPLLKGGALVAVVLASLVLALACARVDKKLADDFLIHVLAKSALLGNMAFVFALALWQAMLAHQLGGVSSYVVLGVFIACWSLGYFLTRLRGTNA